LAQFLTPSPFLSLLGIVPKSPWENSRPIVFLSKREGQSNSSPSQTEEMPTVPDLLSSANSFATPVQWPPVDPLPDGKHRLLFFCLCRSSWSFASTSCFLFSSSYSYLSSSESDIKAELIVDCDDIVVKDQERKFHRTGFESSDQVYYKWSLTWFVMN